MTDTRLGRRRFLGTAAGAAVATVATAAATPSTVSATARRRGKGGPTATFRWLPSR